MNFFTDDISNGYNWKGLERAVARIMEHIGFKHTTVIGGSGYKGCDILAIKKELSESKYWVVQAKAVTGSQYIGPKSLQEAIAALSFYGADIAVVATNGQFTNTAFQRQITLENNGYKLKLWNGAFIQKLISAMPENNAGIKRLRPYQDSIIEKVIEAYQRGENRAFYIIAAGLGKTVIASSIAQYLWEKGHHRILVLCHSIDLALQLEQGFWPQIKKDIPTSVFFNGLPPRNTKGISFGLYQSLYGYLPGIGPNQFDVIIVDEAHHALAHGFKSCLEHLTPKFLIGMTATPWRGDGQNIATIFGEPIYKLSLVDGMALGYLAKVDYRIFCDNINWENIHKISRHNLTIRSLNKRLFLPQRDEAVISEITKVIKDISNPKIVIFSPSIEHSNRFAAMLSAAGISCVSLSNLDKDERRKRLLGFNAGKFPAVSSVDILNEGIDIPDANVLVFLRATHSRRIFIQQLGRGLRLSKGKEKVIVLDFVSDIRRIAEMLDMNNEGKIKGEQHEVVYLKNGFVSFSDSKVEEFVNVWLKDVANLGESNDDATLTFPDFF
jgi:superfamily II DNA or RNA helicase